jgi:hypothetical protein
VVIHVPFVASGRYGVVGRTAVLSTTPQEELQFFLQRRRKNCSSFYNTVGRTAVLSATP